MTTSYGNVVGTPLDEIPDISATNYDKTSADLAGKINTNIDAVTEDARRQSAYLQEILKAQAEKPLDTLKAINEFGRQGVKFKDVAEKFVQAREYISEADEALNKGLDLNEIAEEEDYKNLGAVFTGDLWKDGSAEALDLIVADNETETSEGNNMREVTKNLLPQILDGGHNWRELNGSLSANTKGEYVKLYNQSEELMTVSLLYQLQDAGVDINSRAFKKLWRQKIYPELLRRKENNMLSFERRFEINADKRRDTKITNDITETLEKIEAIQGDSDTDRQNKAALMTNLINRVKLQFNFEKNTQATNKISDIISNSINTRDGNFFPKDADFFMNDALFMEASSGKIKTFEDLLIGSTPQFKDNIRNNFTRAINNHNVDPEDEFKAKASLFEAEIVEPLRQKFPTGVVEATDLAQARVEWERRFGNKYPFPQSILSFNSKQFTGAHLSGASYADRIGKGNPYKDYFENIDGQVVQLFKQENPDIRGVYNLKDLPLSESFRATLAKEQFAFDMDLAKAANPGKSEEELAQEVMPNIETDLKDKSKFVVKPSQAGGVSSIELADYATDYHDDNSIINKPEYRDIFEQAAIDEGHIDLLNGKPPGRYWIELGKRLKMSPTYLLMTRIKAMGGYEDDKISTNKLLFDLSEEQRKMLFRNPSLNKTINLFLNKDTQVPIFQAMKQTKIIDGKEQYVDEGYYTQRNGGRVNTYSNGNRISIKNFSNMVGVNNIGIYGFSKENLQDIINYKTEDGKPLIDINAPFTEDLQTQAVVILSKIQLNKKGVISGMKVDINKLDNRRLSSITEQENDMLNTFFLNLNDADIMANWNTHSDDLNNIFIGDSEQRVITQNELYDESVGEGVVENFVYNERNNKILLKNLDQDKEYTKYSDLPKQVQDLLLKKLRLRRVKNEDGFNILEPKPSMGRKK